MVNVCDAVPEVPVTVMVVSPVAAGEAEMFSTTGTPTEAVLGADTAIPALLEFTVKAMGALNPLLPTTLMEAVVLPLGNTLNAAGPFKVKSPKMFTSIVAC